VADPTPSCLKHLWLQRFGQRLLALQPELNAVAAAKRALDAFHDLAGLDPERAAEAFAASDERSDSDAAS
jgi:hypothetical protein